MAAREAADFRPSQHTQLCLFGGKQADAQRVLACDSSPACLCWPWVQRDPFFLAGDPAGPTQPLPEGHDTLFPARSVPAGSGCPRMPKSPAGSSPHHPSIRWEVLLLLVGSKSRREAAPSAGCVCKTSWADLAGPSVERPADLVRKSSTG